MAGSYNHIIDDDGNLLSNKNFAKSIENLGDAYEMTEEMYGMIWWLADKYASGAFGPARDLITADLVEEARQKYQVGLGIAKTNSSKKKQR